MEMATPRDLHVLFMGQPHRRDMEKSWNVVDKGYYIFFVILLMYKRKKMLVIQEEIFFLVIQKEKKIVGDTRGKTVVGDTKEKKFSLLIEKFFLSKKIFLTIPKPKGHGAMV